MHWLQAWARANDGFVENLEASALFWIFDVAVIVILLPLALHFLDDNRWRETRCRYRDVIRSAELSLTIALLDFQETLGSGASQKRRVVTACVNASDIIRSYTVFYQRSLTPNFIINAAETINLLDSLSSHLQYIDELIDSWVIDKDSNEDRVSISGYDILYLILKSSAGVGKALVCITEFDVPAKQRAESVLARICRQLTCSAARRLSFSESEISHLLSRVP